jgi:hypothetical protein
VLLVDVAYIVFDFFKVGFASSGSATDFYVIVFVGPRASTHTQSETLTLSHASLRPQFADLTPTVQPLPQLPGATKKTRPLTKATAFPFGVDTRTNSVNHINKARQSIRIPSGSHHGLSIIALLSLGTHHPPTTFSLLRLIARFLFHPSPVYSALLSASNLVTLDIISQPHIHVYIPTSTSPSVRLQRPA